MFSFPAALYLLGLLETSLFHRLCSGLVSKFALASLARVMIMMMMMVMVMVMRIRMRIRMRMRMRMTMMMQW